jgi:hypothetical protein
MHAAGQNPPHPFRFIPKGMDLNTPPTNWLRGGAASLAPQERDYSQISSVSIAEAVLPRLIAERAPVDIISNSQTVKRLLKAPLSKQHGPLFLFLFPSLAVCMHALEVGLCGCLEVAPASRLLIPAPAHDAQCRSISLAVHRIGETMLIDDFDTGEQAASSLSSRPVAQAVREFGPHPSSSSSPSPHPYLAFQHTISHLKTLASGWLSTRFAAHCQLGRIPSVLPA